MKIKKKKDLLKAFGKPQRASMTFLPENQEVVFDPRIGLSVLQVGLLAKVPLGHSCGGNGTCTTCRVFIDGDLEALPESAQTRNLLEAEAALERGFEARERLSCQLIAFDGLRVRRPNAAEAETGDPAADVGLE